METKEKKEHKKMEIIVFLKRVNELKALAKKAEKWDITYLKWKVLMIGEYNSSVDINEIVENFSLININGRKLI